MVRHCCVLGCVTDSRYHPDAKFFKFPGGVKKKDLRQQWVRNVNKLTKEGAVWVAKDNDVVCHRHFVDGRPSLEHPVPQEEMGHNNVVKVTVRPTVPQRQNKRAQRQFSEDMAKDVPLESVGFPCGVCQVVFLTQEACSKHQQSHTARSYTCSQCTDYSSTDYHAYSQHLLTHGPPHTDDAGMRIWPCKSCGDVFTTEEAKVDHACSESGGEGDSKPYTCRHCAYCTPSHTDYRQHLLTHSQDSDMTGAAGSDGGEEPYTCPNSSCTDRAAYLHHLTTHGAVLDAARGELKPFTCSQCDKAFRTPYRLKIHARTHTGEKPYVCPLCDRAFCEVSSLTRHVKAHTQGKVKAPKGRTKAVNSKSHPAKTLKHSPVEESEVDFDHDKVETIEKIDNYDDKAPGTTPVLPRRSSRRRSVLLQSHHVTYAEDTSPPSSDSERTIDEPPPAVNKSPVSSDSEHTIDNVPSPQSDYEEPHTVIKQKRSVRKSKRGIKFGSKKRSSFAGSRKVTKFSCSYCDKSYKLSSQLKLHVMLHTGEKPHVCSDCGKGFRMVHDLRVHALIHSGEKPHVCSDCGKAFRLLSSLSRHQRIHQDRKPYVCSHCGKDFRDSSGFNRHMMRHTGEKRHACGFCDMRFISSSHCKIHQRTHTRERPYVCSQCGRGFGDSFSLKRHTMTHTGEKPHTCGVCGKGFIAATSLKQHMLLHTVPRPHKCSHCGKAFTSLPELKVHMEDHAEDKTHVCQDCGKGFNTPYGLKRHTMIHTGEKPFTCTHCDLKFVDINGLKNHQMTHSGEKPYVCDTCGKGYIRPRDLKKHVLSHTGEKPPPARPHMERKQPLCASCGKVFTCVSSLEIHMRTHTGEKPYPCTHCDKRFSTSFAQSRHVMTHTGQKPFLCAACGKGFSSRYVLRSHMKIHSGDRSYVCQHCNKRFRFASGLSGHMKAHTGKPHHCVHCGKGFYSAIRLKDHLPTHTGEKCHVCQYCSKTFSQSAYLTVHLRTHTGEKPYVCTHCGKGFSQRSSQKSHMRTHNKDKVSQPEPQRSVPAAAASLGVPLEAPLGAPLEAPIGAPLRAGSEFEKYMMAHAREQFQLSLNESKEAGGPGYIPPTMIAFQNNSKSYPDQYQNPTGLPPKALPVRQDQPMSTTHSTSSHTYSQAVSQYSPVISPGVERYNIAPGLSSAYSAPAGVHAVTCTTSGHPVGADSAVSRYSEGYTPHNPMVVPHVQGQANSGHANRFDSLVLPPQPTVSLQQPFYTGNSIVQSYEAEKNQPGEKSGNTQSHSYTSQFGDPSVLQTPTVPHPEERSHDGPDVTAAYEICTSPLSEPVHEGQDSSEVGSGEDEEADESSMVQRQDVTSPDEDTPAADLSGAPRSGGTPSVPRSDRDPLQCPVCKEAFSTVTDLDRHMLNYRRDHSYHRDRPPQPPPAPGSKRHLCNLCGKLLSGLSKLHIHLRIHTGEKPYSCPHCPRRFHQTSGLERHVMIHTGERPYQCELCPKGFRSANQLKMHLIVHTGVKPHVCGTCGRGYRVASLLLLHQRVHTGERPLVCTVCNKRFRVQNGLRSHMKTHTGEKPHLCADCGKRFRSAIKLTEHMTTHTGEKPHPCQYCSKRFSRASYLTVHLRTHTGEKPYVCADCGKGFSQRSSLKVHSKTHNKDVAVRPHEHTDTTRGPGHPSSSPTAHMAPGDTEVPVAPYMTHPPGVYMPHSTAAQVPPQDPYGGEATRYYPVQYSVEGRDAPMGVPQLFSPG